MLSGLHADFEIYDNTLQIPHPYTAADADFRIALNEEWRKKEPRLTSFAIRNSDGLLLGNAGFHDLVIGKTHKAEIGYWLAKRFWGKGIMTAVVGKLVEMGTWMWFGFWPISSDYRLHRTIFKP